MRRAATCPLTCTALSRVGSKSAYQSGELIQPTGGMSPRLIACIARRTCGRPYPNCRSKPLREGQFEFGSSMSDAVALATCTTSALLSGASIW